MYCSPKAKSKSKKACSNLDDLLELVKAYNSKYTGSPIQIEGSNEENILSELENKFKDVCKDNSDSCWIEQPFIKDNPEIYNRLAKNFRPIKPQSWLKNSRQWLNTYNILDVMKQYELVHTDFVFAGVFPIDFSKNDVCSIYDSCNFSIKKMQEDNKKRFGFVFNLDRHNEPGSHWVSLFGNIDPSSPQFGMCYFDSGGNKPLNETLIFMKYISKQIQGKHIIKYNHVQKQFKNTECGVFSIWFLALCLYYPTKTYREIRSHVHKDDDAAKLRNYFWRPTA